MPNQRSESFDGDPSFRIRPQKNRAATPKINLLKLPTMSHKPNMSMQLTKKKPAHHQRGNSHAAAGLGVAVGAGMGGTFDLR
jgi:hypothetical protein